MLSGLSIDRLKATKNMLIKEIYHKYKREKMKSRISPFVSLSKDSFYGNGFYVDIRFPEKGHIYLETG